VEVNPVQKVVAYITQVHKLLIFRHTKHPEVGIQVPAGTIEGGETPAEAVLREAEEETGLSDLSIEAYLGEQFLDLSPFGRDEVVRRHFYLLVLTSAAPACWRHFEMNPSEGNSVPVEFEFYWVKHPNETPKLSGELGAFLGQLE